MVNKALNQIFGTIGTFTFLFGLILAFMLGSGAIKFYQPLFDAHSYCLYVR